MGVVLAVIRHIHVLAGRSPEILRPVSIDALGPVVLQVFLGTVSCFVFVHVKHLCLHDCFELHQVLREVRFRLR